MTRTIKAMSATHSIKITYPTGMISYMSFRGRTAWSYSQARRHLADWVYLHGISAVIVKN